VDESVVGFFAHGQSGIPLKSTDHTGPWKPVTHRFRIGVSPSVDGYDLWMNEANQDNGAGTGPGGFGGPRIRFVNLGGDRMAQAFQMAQGQPNWAVRLAVLTFLLVVGIPILLLLLIAGLAAFLVFMVLSGFNWFLNLFQGSSRQNQGRRNVKVINRK